MTYATIRNRYYPKIGENFFKLDLVFQNFDGGDCCLAYIEVTYCTECFCYNDCSHHKEFCSDCFCYSDDCTYHVEYQQEEGVEEHNVSTKTPNVVFHGLQTKVPWLSTTMSKDVEGKSYILHTQTCRMAEWVKASTHVTL